MRGRALLAVALAVAIAIGGVAATRDAGALTLQQVRLECEPADANAAVCSWTPVMGAAGYRFSHSLTPKRPHTWDGGRSTVRVPRAVMNEGEWVKVEALTASEVGVWPPPAVPEPPPPPAAQVAVAANGNDSTCARGDLSRACRTLNRAYEIAQCGDVVQVAAGSYPGQELDAADKACAGRHVRFQTGTGAAATFATIRAGSGADWVELNGGPGRTFVVTGRLNLWDATNDWRIVGVDGGSFDISGSRFYLTGNDWGPCEAGGADCGGQNFLSARDTTIDGDTFHDFTIRPGSGAHFECLFVNGTAGSSVIRNSRFFNCETYGIFFQAWHSSHVFAGSLTVENNWFGRTCCYDPPLRDRESAVTFASPKAVSNILIRFNSFAPGQAVTSEGGVQPTNTRAVGNSLGANWCVTGIAYSYNVMPGVPCSGVGNVRHDNTAALYANASARGDGDYHLAGPPGPADGAVTGAGADAQVASDRDGQPRTTPRDAGADER